MGTLNVCYLDFDTDRANRISYSEKNKIDCRMCKSQKSRKTRNLRCSDTILINIRVTN